MRSSSDRRRPRAEVAALLATLEARGVAVSLRGEDLELRAPKGALDPELVGRLRAVKSELVGWLASRSGARASPATGAQRQLWFVHQLAPAADAFTFALFARIRGALDVRALADALTDLVDRHEALRTTFAVDGDEVMAVVAARGPAVLVSRRVDSVAALEAAIEQQMRRPFDLATGPLFRALLLDPADGSHAMVLTMHHAVVDGLSGRILLEDLGALYEARSMGRAPALDPPPVQMSDYVQERARQAKTPAYAEQLAYWRATLADLESVGELPSDFPRPASPTFNGAEVHLPVEPSGLADLASLQARTGATSFMLLMAALNVVLSRWTGHVDLAVGVPVTNRPSPGHRRLVGMCVDTLVVRVEVDHAATFAALVARVKDATLAAVSHPDVPLADVVAEVRPKRALSASPLFSVMLNVPTFAPPELDLPGLDVSVTQAMPGARFDLTVHAHLRPGQGLALKAAYSTDLFRPERVSALLRQLRAVLAQAAADPTQLVSSFSLRVAADVDRLPVVGRGLVCSPAPPVHAAFLAAAERGPTRVAVRAAGEGADWRYLELRAASRDLADRLRAAGVGPGHRVVVEGARCPALVTHLLGVLQAGAAFVVIDPAYAKAHAELGAAIDPSARVTIDGRVISSASSGPPREPIEDLAHVVFTTGTSGRPKGVLGAHQPLAHFVDWYARRISLGPDDRVSLLSGLTHDPLLRDIFPALAVGARVCVPPGDPAALGPSLLDWLWGEAVSVAHLTPALGRLILSGAGAGSGVLPALRVVVFGGDVLRPDDVRRFAEVAPNAALFNAYGATETPQIMGLHRVDPSADGRAACVPIGRGVEGVELVLEGPAGQPAGVGELAEIQVRTPYLALGYLDDPELTRARFTTEPGEASVRRYRTGDLGRYRFDGAVELVGRIDRQVKVRGWRVDPAIVEAVLAEHPEVASVAVRAQVDASGELGLIAFVVPSAGATGRDLAAAASAWLGERLGPAWIPGRIVARASLPIDRHGKLDHRALACASPEPEDRDHAPSGGVERAVAAVWSAALGRVDIGRDDDFFALGGHSLLAAHVAGRLRDLLGVSLPLSAMFEARSVAALALRLEQGMGAPVPRLSGAARDEAVFATWGQRRMWTPDRTRGPGASARIVRSVAVKGALDLDRLDRALVELELRHEALRTCFELRDDRPILTVAPPRSSVLDRHPSSPDPSWSVDLTRDRPWRVRVWPSGADRWVLEISAHHAAVDGLSYGVLMDDLDTLYGGGSLAPLAATYRDFAAWQARCLNTGAWASQLAWWRDRLAGLPDLDLSARSGARGSPTGVAGTAIRALDDGLVQRMHARAQAAGATPFMVLLSAYVAALQRWTGQDDVAIGTPLGALPHPALRGVVGMFLNRVVLRCDGRDVGDLQGLLERVRETTLRALARSDVPYAVIVRSVLPTLEPPRASLIRASFNLVDVGALDIELPGLVCEALPAVPTQVARTNLTLYAAAKVDGLTLALVFDRGLLNAANGERLLDAVVSALGQLVDAPGTILSGGEVHDQ